MNKVNKLLLHLSLIDSIGSATITKLLGHGSGTTTTKLFSSLYDMSEADLIAHFHISARIARNIANGLREKVRLEKELELIERYTINLYTLLDQSYPAELKRIHLPPVVLYCKGAKFDASKRIAFVGSRTADAYGQRIISLLIPALVDDDWQIVSGGARGADSMAHYATLQAGGITHVVFGAGLLHTYPKENKELFRAIVANGGTLISCFSLNTPPARGNFPARNRVIAGLSNGCVVLQAGKKSGALITGYFALEQGRQVFSVPGPIDNPLSVGCHALIKDGAKLVCSARDIVEEFNQLPNQKKSPIAQNDRPELSGIPRPTVKQSLLSTPAIDENNRLLSLLVQAQPIDQLHYATGIALDQLQSQLFALQLEGKVQQNIAGLWQRF